MAKKYILHKIVDKEFVYLKNIESKLDLEKKSVEITPELSENIEDAMVYEDCDEAIHVNGLLENQFELMPYTMKAKERVLRSISFVFACVIIVPLYFVTCFAHAPIHILSNFMYDNFKEFTLPDQVLNSPGTGANSIGFLKNLAHHYYAFDHAFF
jgi:hypothetical protein